MKLRILITGIVFAVLLLIMGVLYAANGDLIVNGQIISNITGVAPMTVSSTSVVTNLNADMVDGYHAVASPAPNTVPVSNSSANLDAWVFPNYVSGRTTSVAAGSCVNVTLSNGSYYGSNGSISGLAVFMNPLIGEGYGATRPVALSSTAVGMLGHAFIFYDTYVDPSGHARGRTYLRICNDDPSGKTRTFTYTAYLKAHTDPHL